MAKQDWFKHDLNSRSGVKMSVFFNEFGALGYGVFWAIIEQLYREEEHQICVAEDQIDTLLSFLKISKIDYEKIIKKLINLKLVRLESDFITSDRVDHEIAKMTQHYEKVRESRRIAGAKGGKVKQTQANASKPKQTEANQANASKTKPEEIRLDNNSSVFIPSSSIKNNSVSVCVPDRVRGTHSPPLKLKKNYSPISKIEFPNLDLDEYEKMADSKLYIAGMAEEWETDNRFITAGRRPMIDYPQIWMTRTELAEILRQYSDVGLLSKMREANQIVNSKLMTMVANGQDPTKVSAANWYIGWVKTDLLNQMVAETKLENQLKFKSK